MIYNILYTSKNKWAWNIPKEPKSCVILTHNMKKNVSVTIMRHTMSSRWALISSRRTLVTNTIKLNATTNSLWTRTYTSRMRLMKLTSMELILQSCSSTALTSICSICTASTHIRLRNLQSSSELQPTQQKTLLRSLNPLILHLNMAWTSFISTSKRRQLLTMRSNRTEGNRSKMNSPTSS